MTKHIDLDALQVQKPCPFCGGKLQEDGHSADCYILLRVSNALLTREEWDAAWNRRADTSKSAQVKETALPLTPADGKEREDHIEDGRGMVTCRVDYLRANFTPFYLLANARRIASAEFRHQPNWVLAMNLFAVGSNSAHAICREAGIDPDAYEVRHAATPQGKE